MAINTDHVTDTFTASSGTLSIPSALASTGANTFFNAAGQTFRQAATQDGILITGRAGGTSSFDVVLTPAVLSADQTLTLPNVTGTVVTTGDTGSITSAMIANGTIVNEDVSATAAIAGTKIFPDFGEQLVVVQGTDDARIRFQVNNAVSVDDANWILEGFSSSLAEEGGTFSLYKVSASSVETLLAQITTGLFPNPSWNNSRQFFVDADANFEGHVNVKTPTFLTSSLRLWDSANSGWVGIKSPDTALFNTTYTLPDVGGTDGQVLQTNGVGGVTSWRSVDPSWYGVVYGAYGDCDPQKMLETATTSGTVAPTPTNIAVSVARIAYFVPPKDITVNRIRFYGVGATTNLYRVAIYNGDTLARLTAELPFSTAANTWGAAGTSLNLTLTAGQLYFIAVAVNVTGTTAGVLAFGPTVAGTTGQIAVLPKNYPGSLDIDLEHIKGAFAQFAVTNGALPATAPAIATQAAWTGGMPAFWLDSNNA